MNSNLDLTDSVVLDLTIEKGKTLDKTIVCQVVSGDDYGFFNFSGYSANLIVKKKPNDFADVLKFSTTDSSIQFDIDGRLVLSKTVNQTNIRTGSYVYELTLTNSGGTRGFLRGNFIVVDEGYGAVDSSTNSDGHLVVNVKSDVAFEKTLTDLKFNAYTASTKSIIDSAVTLAGNGLNVQGRVVRIGGVVSGATVLDSSTSSFTHQINTNPSKATFLKGTIGVNTNVPLFTIKNSSSNLSTGMFDVVIGGHTGKTLTTGATAGNISIGSRNLNNLKSTVSEYDGGRNIAIGYENQFASTSGTHHILIGRNIQRNATFHASGQNGYNVGIGYEVFKDAVNLNEANVAIGLSTAQNVRTPNGAIYGVSYNTFIGEQAAINARLNGSNIVIGDWAGRYYSGNSANIIIGTQAAELARLGANPNTQGNSNIIIGIQAGRQINVTSGTLDFNVLIGVLAGNNVAGGTHSVAIGPETYNYGRGSNSTAIGRWAGARFQGDNNSGFGAYAGYHGSLNLTGTSNTFLGYQSTYSTAGLSNTIAIGNNVIAALSNKIYLGATTQKIILTALPTSGNSSNNNVLVRNSSSGEIESRSNFVDTGTLQILSNKYLFTGTTIGATPTIVSGAKFGFRPNATQAGMNVGSISSTDPSTLVDYDVWGHSNSQTIRTRMGGTTRQIAYSMDNSPIVKSIPYIGFSNQMQLLYDPNFIYDSSTSTFSTRKLKLVDTPTTATGTTEILVRDSSTGMVTSINASDISTIDRVSVSYTSSLAINLSSKEQRRFVITGVVTGNSTVSFTSASNIDVFTVDITPTATINLTLPSTTRMQQYEVDNSRWNTSTRVLSLTAGAYQLTFSYDGSVYKLNCSDKYV